MSKMPIKAQGHLFGNPQLFFFLNPHLRTRSLTLERGVRGGERGREISM